MMILGEQYDEYLGFAWDDPESDDWEEPEDLPDEE